MKLAPITTCSISLVLIAHCSRQAPQLAPEQAAQHERKEQGEEVAAAEAWHNLIADETLSEWQTWNKGSMENAPAWRVVEGVLELSKAPELRTKGGSIVTRKGYIDFELKFEFKISQGGNSGVKYRSLNNLGLEYQILDDAAASANLKALNKASSLYQLVAAAESKKLHPAGKWNSGRILAQGEHLEHWLNGEKVLEVDIGSAQWSEAFAKSKFRYLPKFAQQGGEILLQDHGDAVSYRKLFIRELK